MFKRSIPLLVLIAAMFFVYSRPLSIEEGASAFLPRGNVQSDFGRYPAFEHRDQIYVVLSAARGDIFDGDFLRTLKGLANDIFFLPGVDRTRVASLFNVDVTFRDVVDDGFEGGPIIPEDISYDKNGLDEIRRNLLKSPYVGGLVSYDLKSTLIAVPVFNVSDERKITRQIEKMLPHNDRIHAFVLGYIPFMMAMQAELTRALLFLLLSWFAAAMIWAFAIRRSPLSLFTAPLLALSLQLILYRCFSHSLHPFVLPVLIFTGILAFIDRAWAQINEGDHTSIFPVSLACMSIIPSVSLYFLGSSLGKQMSYLVLSGAGALFVTHALYLRTAMAVNFKKARTEHYFDAAFGIRNMVCWFILAAGLTAASHIVIGNTGAGPVLLKENTRYRKAAAFMNDHFAYTADSMTVTAITAGKGCADPATVTMLDDFHWFLTGFLGVRMVSSLSEAVKRVNMFFHENHPKWRAIPREPATLVFATGQLDPRTGLLDDDGLILPVTVYLNGHDPRIIHSLYRGIKEFKRSVGGSSLKITAGAAALEAMLNESIAASSKWILLVLLGCLLLVSLVFVPFRQTVVLCFVLCVLLSTAFGFIAMTGMGLNTDTIIGVVLSVSLCYFFLGLRWCDQTTTQKTDLLLVLCLAVLAGGLFSGLEMIFRNCCIAIWMLGMMRFLVFIVPGPRVALPVPPAAT